MRGASILDPLTSWIDTVLTNIASGPRAFSTGIPQLDEVLGGGVSDGQGLVIGGPSESGKSLFVQNIIYKIRALSVPAAYIDFENGRLRLLDRFFSMAGFSRLVDRLPTLNDASERKALKAAKRKVVCRSGGALYCPEPRVVRSQEQIAAFFGELRARHPRGHLLVVIDSLHKLPSPSNDRRSAIDDWCFFLEEQRRKHNLTLIITAELARNHSPEDPFKESTEIKYSNDIALVISGTDNAKAGTLRLVKDRDNNLTQRDYSAQVVYPWVEIGPAKRASAAPRKNSHLIEEYTRSILDGAGAGQCFSSANAALSALRGQRQSFLEAWHQLITQRSLIFDERGRVYRPAGSGNQPGTGSQASGPKRPEPDRASDGVPEEPV